MKTSTMLFLGGAAALAYYMYQKQNPLTGATTGSLTHGANPPTATVDPATSSLAPAVMSPPFAVPAVAAPPEDDYSDIVPLSYAWAPPAYGGRAWSGGGGRRHGGHGHGRR